MQNVKKPLENIGFPDPTGQNIMKSLKQLGNIVYFYYFHRNIDDLKKIQYPEQVERSQNVLFQLENCGKKNSCGELADRSWDGIMLSGIGGAQGMLPLLLRLRRRRTAARAVGCRRRT